MTLVLVFLVFLALECVIFLNTKYFRSNFSLESDELVSRLVVLKKIQNKGNRNVGT